MARAPRATSKAGRNEGRKLFATLLNNLAVAALLAGLLQPILVVLRLGQPFTRGDLASALVLGVSGLILHSTARYVVSRLED